MDSCQAMTDNKAFDVLMVNESTCQLLDTTIEDARNSKENLGSTMALVINLMKEVECKEKAAEQAKEEAATSSLDIFAKVDELKQAQLRAKESYDTHAREVFAQKAVLAAEMKELQNCVSRVLSEGGKSLGDLDEMRKALENRLASAIREKELADKEKVQKESLARKALAHEENQMKKALQESERLKQEAVKNSKLQEFLVDRANVACMLDKEMSDKCKDVKLLKESIDQSVLLSQTSSNLASSSSCLTTSVIPCHEPQIKTPNECTEPADFQVSSDSANGNVVPETEPLAKIPDSDLKKQAGNQSVLPETDIKNAPVFADITEWGDPIPTEGSVFSAGICAEGVASGSTVEKVFFKKPKGRMRGWGTVPRRIASARNPTGYF